MMLDNPYAKAALAALFIAFGVALLASAVEDVRATQEPCVDCGKADPEETIAQVAHESAVLNGDEEDEDVA
jgi:hypothetical protein